MSDSIGDAETEVAAEKLLVCRRRPGRRETVHPSLTPLLRGTPEANFGQPSELIAEGAREAEPIEWEEDALGPARGILFGVGLSVPMWLVLALLVVHLLN